MWTFVKGVSVTFSCNTVVLVDVDTPDGAVDTIALDTAKRGGIDKAAKMVADQSQTCLNSGIARELIIRGIADCIFVALLRQGIHLAEYATATRLFARLCDTSQRWVDYDALEWRNDYLLDDYARPGTVGCSRTSIVCCPSSTGREKRGYPYPTC